MAKAVASGMPKLKIEEAAARRQARIDSGKGERSGWGRGGQEEGVWEREESEERGKGMHVYVYIIGHPTGGHHNRFTRRCVGG